MRAVVSVATLLFVCTIAEGASAQDEADHSRDREAQALFAAGREAFAQGRYENALEHFRRAHEISARAELLYNIASTADRLRRDEEALEAFERFIEAVPETPLRPQVEGRIEALRRSIEERRALEQRASDAGDVEPTPDRGPADAAPGPRAPEPQTSGGFDVAPGAAGIVALAVGAIGAVVGMVLFADVESQASRVDAQRAETVRRCREGEVIQSVCLAEVAAHNAEVGRLNDQMSTSAVLLGAGSAAVVAGVVLLVVASSSGAAPERAWLRCSPTLSGLTCGGRF